MDTAVLERLLDDTFDHAVVHHGYTTYLRDYEVVVHATADPRNRHRTGLPALPVPLLRRGPLQLDGDT
ncbi:hypothetical protein QIS99_11410 [Streptomyces sp. B-S-A8]|uniref:YxiG-like domain-containing protein n=1 Tax=Streptomyces solicavernae TaxID=3043614 RepID=A0ABT6RQT8_9ACTN|nr:hypothetical protein [Streptomyces sp. B-S-A8]MDI3386802.1 hypothetical protein [Streptomyces sp. B-S-A8]